MPSSDSGSDSGSDLSEHEDFDSDSEDYDAYIGGTGHSFADIGAPAFARGTELRLLPHINTPPPYGRSVYPWRKDWRKKYTFSPRKHPTGFDPRQETDPEEHLLLKVVHTISGGPGPQVVLFEVLHSPSVQWLHHARVPRPDDTRKILLVGKIFDYRYYSRGGGIFDPPFSSAEIADQDLSREATLYEHLYATNKNVDDGEPIPGRDQLTGPSAFIAEFHGVWVTKLDDDTAVTSLENIQADNSTKTPSNNQDTKEETTSAGASSRGTEAGSSKPSASNNERYVGIVLMEYIDGHSMRDYCWRSSDHGGLVPYSQPKPGRPCMPREEDRLEVFKQIIDGLVRNLKYGIRHENYGPRDFLIVQGAGDRPRVVYLGHSLSTIWRYTQDAKRLRMPRDRFMRLPHPIHPLERLVLNDFDLFSGWFPLKWDSLIEHNKEKGESMFDKWLLKEFGEKRENVPGYHYSVYSTLDKLEEEEKERTTSTTEEIYQQQGHSGVEETS